MIRGKALVKSQIEKDRDVLKKREENEKQIESKNKSEQERKNMFMSVGEKASEKYIIKSKNIQQSKNIISRDRRIM